MKLLNESWEILQEADKPAKVVFGSKELTDPEGVDLKGIASEKARKQAEAEERAKQEAEDKANKDKWSSLYQETLDKLNKNGPAITQLNTLFDNFVPQSGKAETVLGELVRAIMRILYRDYNDGDVFYEGYGLETAGPSAAYLMSMVTDNFDIYSDIVDIADKAKKHKRYTSAIEDLGEKIIEYIIDYPEEVLKKNDVDSRKFDTSALEAYVPKYSFTIEIPEEVMRYIKAGVRDTQDVYDYIDQIFKDDRSTFEGYELYQSAYSDDTLEVDNLKIEGYETLEQWVEDSTLFEEFIEEIEEELGEES